VKQHPSRLAEIKTMLQWLVASLYPLAAQQLAEIVAISPEDSSLDLDGVCTDPDDAVEPISELVLFESHSSGIVVRLCHFTVREYPNSPGVPERAEDFYIDLGQAHARIAEMCLQYLSFSEFAVPLPANPDAGVRELTSKYSTLGYAAMNWAVHLRESGITSAASHEFRHRILPRLSWFLHPERFPHSFRMWQYVVRYMVQYVVRGQFWYSDACFQSPLCFAIRMGM
jgi:hypothetical protein